MCELCIENTWRKLFGGTSDGPASLNIVDAAFTRSI